MAKPKRDTDFASAIKAIADSVEEEEGRLTARKRRIIEAAIICFAEQGFEATSTSQIARHAEVAEATIFRHFNTKQELLMRLVKPVAGRLLIPAAIEELDEIRATTDGSFRSAATVVMKSRIAFADRYAPLLRIIVQELPLNTELRSLLFSDELSRAVQLVVTTVEGFVERGDIRPDIPPGRIFRWFGSLLIGYYLNRSLMPSNAFDDDAEIEATIDFMMRGAGPD